MEFMALNIISHLNFLILLKLNLCSVLSDYIVLLSKIPLYSKHFPTYFLYYWHYHECVAVSYTHLDVYKRQTTDSLIHHEISETITPRNLKFGM